MTLEQLIGQFKAYTEYPNQDTFVISNQECKDILKYLTALQNQKVGHWIVHEITTYGINKEYLECSECMWNNTLLLIPKNYCPKCGARMIEIVETKQGLAYADQETMMSAT